ncbi:MAG: type-F conjugative transfer system pilin assembly protein TrbC [Legionellales bacterium]|jgi:conjugal transfer pilus assembly protein TrbC
MLLFILISVNAYALDNSELTNLAKSAIEHSQQYQKQLQNHANGMNEIQKRLLNTQHQQPKLFIAVSFSMPEKLILDYMQQASQYNAWVVVQGFQNNEMPVMMRTLAEWDQKVDISRLLIDPNIFKQYQITEVPSLILTTDQYPCDSQKCIAESFDKINGSVRFDHALKIMSERGDLHSEAQAWKVKQ